MFSRRLLRIKVFQALYAYHNMEGKTIAGAEKDLLHSINKSYELYNFLLLLLIDVADYAESKIALAIQKKMPTDEDLNPNTKFIENYLFAQLRNNKFLANYLRKHPLSWVQYPEIVRNLYGMIREMEFFNSYMDQKEHIYASDKKLIERIYLDVIMNYEDLYLNLEDQSIYWIDDVDFVIHMIVKTLKNFKQDNTEGGSILPMFKDPDDLEYGKRLLRSTIRNEKECLQLIKDAANNWELERIAFTDNLILQLALTEAMEFQSIPTKVTINEFIEIAKIYSTEKSSQFINGILDHVMGVLKEKGKIVKTGRGLIGEQ